MRPGLNQIAIEIVSESIKSTPIKDSLDSKVVSPDTQDGRRL